MVVDTGWDVDRIDLKYGTQLGFGANNAIGGAAATTKNKEYTMHLARMKIGTLQPILTYLQVSTANTGYNVFGNLPMRQFGSFIITRASVTATDSTTGGGTAAGLLAATKDFLKYTFVGGVPALANTATAAAKQALYVIANSRSNSQANWRNRI